VKSISTHSKSTVLIVRTLKKHSSRDTFPLKGSLKGASPHFKTTLAFSQVRKVKLTVVHFLNVLGTLKQQCTLQYMYIHYTQLKKVREFPFPSRDVTTKLSMGGNNDVITELFLPRGSLVSDIPAGDGKVVNLFLRCIVPDITT
jgi:hypothetical protein